MPTHIGTQIDYMFIRVGLNRIEAYHSVNNPASGRVMQKAGMICEGHAREKYRNRDGYQDCDLNTASKRVCEKLGAKLIRVARLPEWHDLYKEGNRFVNVFEWAIE